MSRARRESTNAATESSRRSHHGFLPLFEPCFHGGDPGVDPLQPGYGFAVGNGGYLVAGGGHDIWDNADGFHFVYKEVSGPFDMRARVKADIESVTQEYAIVPFSNKNEAVARIILARPAVEAGEKLGFLPGDLQQKVDPYLRPLYDALYDMMDFEKVERLIARHVIEVAPIAFMRGRTLSDAFVIIDEAQNTTPEQMKMVLTRIGFGSKVVVTGDITQVDLPQGRTSGLVDAINVLKGVEGIGFSYFDQRDVVRHKLVQSVIKAYEKRDPQVVAGGTQ